MNNKQLTAVVLLDMSQAFDGQDHGILISKFEDVGASNNALKWFKSYLTNRRRAVRTNCTLSDTLEITNGYRKEAYLGPCYSAYKLTIYRQYRSVVQLSAKGTSSA